MTGGEGRRRAEETEDEIEERKEWGEKMCESGRHEEGGERVREMRMQEAEGK